MKRLLIFFIIFTTLHIAVSATGSEDIAVIKPIGKSSESGYQEYGLFDVGGNQITPTEREPQISLFSRLPEKYDSRDYGYISPVKSQGQLGTCWAHAFVACAEANMIKKGYEEYFNNYSEAHLAYFYHKRNEAQGDGVDVCDDQYGYFGGGNGEYAAKLAENFQALTVESDFPYSITNNSKDFRIDEKYRDHSDVHMVNFGKLTTADEAKAAIMEYGAISVSYCNRNDYLSDDAAYYQPGNYKTNHEVAVVGWDDSFPVENFNASSRPQNPGAWLVKNSWGRYYGDFGYFWLSYEEPSLVLGCFYDFEPIGDEAKVHTYNGGVGTSLMWECSRAANIFKAEEAQTVYAVGFDATTYKRVPEKYTITVYVSDSQPVNPEKGTKKLTQSGDISYDGFHHIELDTPVELKAGQYISIVVKITNRSGSPAASIFEYGDDFTSRQGESWAYNNGWKNMYNYTNNGYDIKNSTIKAYYKTKTATVHFNIREAEHFDTQTVNIGECVTRPEDPVKEGYEFLGWYTNNTVTDEWDFSTPVTHDMRLFAKWSEPKNIDMKVKSRYFSQQYYPSITLSGDNIKDYTFWFAKDNKYHSYTVSMTPEHLNIWYNYGAKPLGNYTVFADVHGINGEEITSDYESFTVTDETKLSVHEGFIHMVNIPPHGADLYVAQYDDGGHFLSVKKTSHYRSYAQDGVTILTSKVINAPTNYQNPKYFLWSAGTTIPLCEQEN